MGENSSKLFGRRHWLPPTLSLVAVVLLAAWMGMFNGGYFAGQWTLAAMMVAVVALAISLAGRLFRIGSRWGLLAVGLLAAYTAWSFASLSWSINAGDAWVGAGLTLLYLLAFWVTLTLCASGASRRWALGASVLGPTVVSALTLLALDGQIADLFANNRLIGSIGYSNGEAAFLLVPFWVAVYLGGSRRVNPVLRAAVFAGAALSLQLAILTQSRGAMVAIALSLPVFFLLSGRRLRGLLALIPLAAAVYVAFPKLNDVYLAFVGGESPVPALDQALPLVWLTAALAGLYGLLWGLVDRWWRPSRGTALAAGGGALVCCALGLIVGGFALQERVGDPVLLAEQRWESFKNNDRAGQEQSRYLSASGSGRYTMWQVAVEDFKAHPVLGVGAHNYEATYYRLREQSVGTLRQPHSLPLEALAERGVVGGVLFFGFLGVCLAGGLWQRFRNLHAEGKAQVGALVAAVVYWFAHSSGEWFWQLPAITLVAFVYLALLVSPWRVSRSEEESMPDISGWPFRAAGAGIAILSLSVITPLYAAEHYLQRSHDAQTTGKALVAVERAQEFNPLDPQLPQREAELAVQTGEWRRVEEAYSRAIRLNPDHYAPYMFLGSYYEQRLQMERASHYYEKASALNPLEEDLKRDVARLRGEAEPEGE